MGRSIVIVTVLVTCGFHGALVKGHVGTGIDLDRQGRVYFVDTLHNRIWRLDSDGQLTSLAQDMHLDVLIVADDGNLYIIRENVLRITPQGNITEVLRSTDIPKEFGWPFAIDHHGSIYFTNGDIHLKRESQIYRRTSDGKIALVVGSDWGHTDAKGSAAKFGRVNSAAWGPDETLYILDEEQRIRKVSPDGTVSSLAHSEEACYAEGGEERLVRRMGLAVDAENNVYVANYWKRSVFKLSPDGRITTVLSSRWPWVPVGVATAATDVYVVERMGNPYGPSTLLQVSTLEDRLGSPRIRKISRNGAVTTLTVVPGERGLAVIIVLFTIVIFAIVTWRIRKTWIKRKSA
jgi:sugar lactone lactonase YvrE